VVSKLVKVWAFFIKRYIYIYIASRTGFIITHFWHAPLFGNYNAGIDKEYGWTTNQIKHMCNITLRWNTIVVSCLLNDWFMVSYARVVKIVIEGNFRKFGSHLDRSFKHMSIMVMYIKSTSRNTHPIVMTRD
jgi:hypothetical protein